MFIPLQRTLKFTCKCLSIYTRRQSFLEVFHSFSHSSIHLVIHHTFTEHLLCAKHCSRCPGFLSKTMIWPRHSTSSMPSHCQVRTPGHTHPVLAHLHTFVNAISPFWMVPPSDEMLLKCPFLSEVVSKPALFPIPTPRCHDALSSMLTLPFVPLLLQHLSLWFQFIVCMALSPAGFSVPWARSSVLCSLVTSAPSILLDTWETIK